MQRRLADRRCVNDALLCLVLLCGSDGTAIHCDLDTRLTRASAAYSQSARPETGACSLSRPSRNTVEAWGCVGATPISSRNFKDLVL